MTHLQKLALPALILPLLLLPVGLQADILGHWRFESSSLLTDSHIADGASQNLVTAGGNKASIVANPDRAGSQIFDPISGTTLANTGSATGTTTNGGGGTSSPAFLRASQFSLQTANESFTFETIFRIDSQSFVLNNGSATLAKQFSSTGDAGTNEAGWRTQLRPNIGNPDTLGHLDLIDGNNTDDASARVFLSAADLLDGNWHHMAQVYTRSADGTTDTLDTSTSTFNRNFNLDFGTTFMSAPSGGGASQSITWFVDEARYSNNALSAEDFLRAVPEPATGLLSALGGLGLMLLRRRR